MWRTFVLCLLFCYFVVKLANCAVYNISLADRYCEYCLVSYCIGLGGHGVPTWDCPACKEYFPGVQNVTVFKTGFVDYDVHAFVAFEPIFNEIIIAWEGTEAFSITDWIDDFDDTEIVYPLSTACNCLVHKGFYNTYAAIKDEVWAQVQIYLNAFGSNIPVHITGHSLGSALATHCALDGHLNHNTSYDYVYTYGPPRVGDQNFSNFYVSKISNHFRVTHAKDPVAQFPLQWMKKGYHHISHEVYYETDPNGTYVVCDGSGEDPDCRDKYGFDILHVSDHLQYMGFDFVANMIRCKV